jgi:hypothetical protein
MLDDDQHHNSYRAAVLLARPPDVVFDNPNGRRSGNPLPSVRES